MIVNVKDTLTTGVIIGEGMPASLEVAPGAVAHMRPAEAIQEPSNADHLPSQVVVPSQIVALLGQPGVNAYRDAVQSLEQVRQENIDNLGELFEGGAAGRLEATARHREAAAGLGRIAHRAALTWRRVCAQAILVSVPGTGTNVPLAKLAQSGMIQTSR